MIPFDGPFKQADRRPEDGAVRVSRPDDGFLLLEATSAGKTESILVSDYNASRLLAMLSLMLGVKIVKGQRILL